jgi:hypothetical protein
VTKQQAIELVCREIERAEKKHPNWPTDRLRQVVVMCEEAGEALRAALLIIETEEELVGVGAYNELDGHNTAQDAYEVTLQYNRMARLEEDLEDEVVHTAAMALRWLMNRKPLYAKA